MRKTLTREAYLRSDYVQFLPQIEPYKKDLFACYVSKDQPIAQFFIGKQAKPAWHIRFHDNESMKAYILKDISKLMSYEDRKVERAAERKAKVLEVKVGDLFVSSWGYEQTNVDFYQVIAVKGKTFTIREIASKTVEGSTYPHGMADERMPVRDAFLEGSKPIEKRSFKLSSYAWLSPTTDTAKHYCSWYA